MNTLDEYAKFVVMAEDALTTNNTSKMKWLGLEHTRQYIQREMVHLEYFIQASKKNPSFASVRDNYYRSIQSSLKEMKDVIVELRLDNALIQMTDRVKARAEFEQIMGDEYIPFQSGHLLELPMDVKKTIYDKLRVIDKHKIRVDKPV